MLIADLHERLRERLLDTVKTGQISQTAFAGLIGVKQAHISNFLHGRRGLSIEIMDAVLAALGIDVMSLVAMSDQKQASEELSYGLESVPIVQHRAAMNPTFSKGAILGELGFTKVLLRRLNSAHTDTREPWVRFIAVRADAALAAPMYPRFENGSVLLVDRHYCSLFEHRQGQPNLYLLRKEKTLLVRWVEMQGTQLCLRPEGRDYPLDFICIDRKEPLTSYIVGRVAHIATELGGLVQRRPLLS